MVSLLTPNDRNGLDLKTDFREQDSCWSSEWQSTLKFSRYLLQVNFSQPLLHEMLEVARELLEVVLSIKKS